MTICSIKFQFGPISTMSCRSAISSNAMKSGLVPSRYMISAIRRLPSVSPPSAPKSLVHRSGQPPIAR